MSLPGGKFPYVVVLKNATDRAFILLAVLLNFCSAVFFFKEFVLAGPESVIRILGLIVLAGILIWNVVEARTGKKPKYSRAYVISALLWVSMPYMQWMVFPFAILAILEHQVRFPLEVGFSETQIVFNTFFRKKYNWGQLNNVVLKDGLLTMDFVSNRVLQREVEDDDEEDDTSEEEFNLFCREQLKKNPVGLYGNIR